MSSEPLPPPPSFRPAPIDDGDQATDASEHRDFNDALPGYGGLITERRQRPRRRQPRGRSRPRTTPTHIGVAAAIVAIALTAALAAISTASAPIGEAAPTTSGRSPETTAPGTRPIATITCQDEGIGEFELHMRSEGERCSSLLSKASEVLAALNLPDANASVVASLCAQGQGRLPGTAPLESDTVETINAEVCPADSSYFSDPQADAAPSVADLETARAELANLVAAEPALAGSDFAAQVNQECGQLTLNQSQERAAEAIAASSGAGAEAENPAPETVAYWTAVARIYEQFPSICS